MRPETKRTIARSLLQDIHVDVQKRQTGAGHVFRLGPLDIKLGDRRAVDVDWIRGRAHADVPDIVPIYTSKGRTLLQGHGAIHGHRPCVRLQHIVLPNADSMFDRLAVFSDSNRKWYAKQYGLHTEPKDKTR